MLCRVAENLFWTSRYVERALAVARLVDVTAHLELDAGEGEGDDGFWEPLMGTAQGEGYLGLSAPGEDVAARDIRHYLAFDAENPGSLVSCVRRARSAAREIRESISSEMWEQLNTLSLSLVDLHRTTEVEDQPHAFHKRMHNALLLIQGLADGTLAHDEAWHFITLGKFLERADNVARVLSLQAHLLLSAPAGTGSGTDEFVRWLAVLRSCGSAEAYARYYSFRVDPPRVVEFLLLNPVFPQSVRFSLRTARDSLEQIAGFRNGIPDTSSQPVRTLGLLSARLNHTGVDEVLEAGLEEYLSAVQREISNLSEQIAESYFRQEPGMPSRHMAVARAAVIMAAQQQQQHQL